MLGINWQWMRWRALVSFLTAVVLVLSLVSCGDRALTSDTSSRSGTVKTGAKGAVAEVSVPETIQQLRSSLEVYQPQVSIIAPHLDEVFQDTTVEARFQVQDLPIFKDPKLGLGPHLQVILDNQPYQEVYDLNQPLVLKDLSPGTHSLRVFASRPWHESFKNEGAYAQTNFHIFTKTPDNNPSPNLPLLTYSRPTGSYGTEPILLDFYLTNAPLHLVAQEKPNDEIADWRIRVTVNGQSFVLDRWQPIYLKGFKPGKNWVQLEFLDDQGNPVNNVFNNTVRLITYEPKGKDILSKLVRGELSAEAARSIVELNYTAKPTPTPSPIEIPTPSEPVPPSETPALEEKPATPEIKPTELPEVIPPEPKQSEKSQPGGFFNRFRGRPSTQEATPAPTPTQVIPTPAPTEPVQPEIEVPPVKEAPILSPSPTPSPEIETTPSPIPVPTETKQSEQPSSGGFFSRFWQRPATQAPTAVPTHTPEESVEPQVKLAPSEETPTPLPSSTTNPQVEMPPVSKPAPKQEAGKSLPSLEKTPTPTPSVTPNPQVAPALPDQSATVKPAEPKPAKSDELMIPPPAATGKFTPSPVLPPTLPEVIVTPSSETVVPAKKPEEN